ncbi:MAG: hypothetical protein JXB23_15830 [Candidatus Aminicenantes bacterium]|nr:hypothetical protein [Candidatus Aminicenantes bacterium]
MAGSAVASTEKRKYRYVRLSGFFLLGFLLLGTVLSGQEEEYKFDVDEFARKTISLDGYLEFRPTLFSLRRDSAFYKLRYFDLDERKTIGEGYAALLADLVYRKSAFEALIESYLDYTVSPLENEVSANLFQGYLLWKPSVSFSLYAGKKTLRWGKGYAWSPTALAERQKNPNEPDLAREGYWMISADYTKSFQGALKTLSLTPVFIPVSRSVNKTFSPYDGLNFAGKIYLLFLDTDIDLVVLAGESQSARFGLDVSRNLLSNLEVHGEIAVLKDLERSGIADDGSLQTEKFDATRLLMGLRYLSEAETTYILEFYHNGAGFDSPGMGHFYSFVDRAYENYLNLGDYTQLKTAAGLDAYGGFTPMTDYVFLRIVQKDPFGVLYLNPAATVIVNFSDGSATWAPEVVYKGFTNFELRLKIAVLTGKSREEFGEKQNRFRLELRLRYFF